MFCQQKPPVRVGVCRSIKPETSDPASINLPQKFQQKLIHVACAIMSYYCDLTRQLAVLN